MNSLKWLSAATCCVVLAACGGGGGSAGTSPFGTGTTTTCTSTTASGVTGTCPTASSLTLTLNSASVDDTGANKITATATATTSTGQALAGIPVTFTVDGGATFTQSSSATDASGTSVATISTGADPSNRVINVTVTSGSLTATAPFAVTGAKLTGTPNPLIVVPGSAGNKVDFQLLNANASPLANQSISVVAGTLGTSTGTTDINGKFSYTYTAPTTPGNLDVVATAGGVTTTQTVIIQSGTSTVPPATGPIVSASVAANPSVVSTNTTGSTSNQTQIRALFVGANNAPIPRVRVIFDTAGDPNSIGGSFSTVSNVVYSDANGVATTSYIPGTRSSPTNGLTIRACYSLNDFVAPSCPNNTTATITVASDPLAVSIGSNGLIVTGPNNLTYIRQFVVLVVDSSGRAKANVSIVPSLDLPIFFKGQYVHGSSWFQGVLVGGVATGRSPVGCLNEDLNRNGVREASEDDPNSNTSHVGNHSGTLEPRKSDATITILGNGQTDANGSATVQVEYPQNVASWLQIKILVSATGVSGTEGRATWTEILPVPADTLTATATPPFVVSPYGVIIDNEPPTNLTASSPAIATFPDGSPGSAGIITGQATVQPCNNPY